MSRECFRCGGDLDLCDCYDRYNTDAFNQAKELDRLRADNQRLQESLSHVYKDWYIANEKYGPGVKCDHVTLRRPDQPCPECCTTSFLVMRDAPKSYWYDMSEYQHPVETTTWVRDQIVLDGAPIWAWREVE